MDVGRKHWVRISMVKIHLGYIGIVIQMLSVLVQQMAAACIRFYDKSSNVYLYMYGCVVEFVSE